MENFTVYHSKPYLKYIFIFILGCLAGYLISFASQFDGKSSSVIPYEESQKLNIEKIKSRNELEKINQYKISPATLNKYTKENATGYLNDDGTIYFFK